MNSINLALQQEQEQRLESDRTAIEQEADRQTDLYNQGQSDAAFNGDPVYPELQSYWQGYQEQLRRNWIGKKESTRIFSSQGKAKQGYLWQSNWHISKQFGQLAPIGAEQDYQGWEIELNGLEIEIYTLDWEDAAKETKWCVSSIHPDALKFLAEIFGQDAVVSLEVDETFAA